MMSCTLLLLVPPVSTALTAPVSKRLSYAAPVATPAVQMARRRAGPLRMSGPVPFSTRSYLKEQLPQDRSLAGKWIASGVPRWVCLLYTSPSPRDS